MSRCGRWKLRKDKEERWEGRGRRSRRREGDYKKGGSREAGKGGELGRGWLKGGLERKRNTLF